MSRAVPYVIGLLSDKNSGWVNELTQVFLTHSLTLKLLMDANTVVSYWSPGTLCAVSSGGVVAAALGRELWVRQVDGAPHSMSHRRVGATFFFSYGV